MNKIQLPTNRKLFSNFNHFSLGTIAFSLLAGLGCGGGSGGSSPIIPPQNTYNSSPALHVFTGSESYVYALTNATQSVNGVSSPSPTPALRTIAVTKHGTSDFEFKTIDQFGSGNTAIVETQDFDLNQDSQGNLNFVGNLLPTSEELAVTQGSYLAGGYSNSTAFSFSTALNPTGQYSNSSQVLGTTNVTIGIGTFNYVYEIQLNYRVDSVVHTGTVFFDPKLGAIVSGDETTNDSATGTITKFHEELTSYNGVTP